MARRLTSPSLIGRAEELATLLAALERARGGDPSIVLVAGEAGIGKSRLVSEFAAAANARGARVLVGGCIELAKGRLPYGPLEEALRDLALSLDAATLARVVGPAVAEFERLVPHLGPALRRELALPARRGAAVAPSLAAVRPPIAFDVGSQNEDQSRLFDLLLDLFGRLGRDRPMALILEDLHWADPSTLELLLYLARSFRSECVSVIATYRSDDLPSGFVRHALVELATRSSRAEWIELRPFSPEEIAALVRAIAPDADLPAVSIVNRRSAGNPLFAEELLATGPVRERGLSASLSELLLDRVRQLSPRAQHVVGALAVVGHGCDEEYLAAVTGEPRNALSDTLREGVDDQLLRIDAAGNFWFRHDLYAEAVYGDQLPGERRRWHSRAAEVLEGKGSGGVTGAVAAAELAHHRLAAGQPAPAFRASLVAAERAQAVAGYAEAAQNYGSAAGLWDSVQDPRDLAGFDRLELLERTGRAWFEAGEFEHAVEAGRQAEKHALEAGPAPLGRVLQALGTYLSAANRDNEALEAHREAEALLASAGSHLRACAIASIGATLMLLGRREESVEACTESMRQATVNGSFDVAAMAESFLGTNLVFLGRVSDGFRHLRAAIRGLEGADRIDWLLDAYHNSAALLELAGRYDEALATATSGIERADAVGRARRSGAGLRAVAGRTLWRLGRWPEAEAMLIMGLSQGARGEHRHNLLRNYGQLLLGFGRTAEAQRMLAEVAADERADALVELVSAQAEFALLEGRLEEARDALSAALARLSESDGQLLAAPLCSLGLRVEADLAAIGLSRRRSMEVERARQRGAGLLERVQLARRIWEEAEGTPPPAAILDALAATAEWSRLAGQADPDPWRELSAAAGHFGALPRAAYADYRLGAALLAAGARDEAADALGAAQSIVASIGAAPLHRQIEELASRARIALTSESEVKSSTPADGLRRQFRLTPREIDVLGLLAIGRTNRQIARELFISEKTAGLHVSNILAKLEVGSRYDAAEVAEQAGLGRDAPAET